MKSTNNSSDTQYTLVVGPITPYALGFIDVKTVSVLFVVTLWNRAGHYIFAYGFFVSSSFLLFPRLISAVGDWMSTVYTWCGLSANLECMPEMCCTQVLYITPTTLILPSHPLTYPSGSYNYNSIKICKQISTPSQPYQKIPDIYFLRSCSLPNFITIPSPITIQFVVDVFIVCYFVSFIVLPIVLFGLTTTKLNKIYYYNRHYENNGRLAVNQESNLITPCLRCLKRQTFTGANYSLAFSGDGSLKHELTGVRQVVMQRRDWSTRRDVTPRTLQNAQSRAYCLTSAQCELKEQWWTTVRPHELENLLFAVYV